jgi:hypothetical protein
MARHHSSEAESRELAESSREATWKGRGFLRELFLGTLRVDWIDPYPEFEASPEFAETLTKWERFFTDEVDSARIDAEGAYGDDVIAGLRRLGAFGLKIDKKYGGVGLSQPEYARLMETVSAFDGSIAALVSAHNSIGVPMPLAKFGTEALKQRYLPRCAAGAISAFALTEPDVGSDPARLATVATRDAAGDYVLDGEKLWITNGTIAELMVVMARHADTGKISAFVVETAWDGVSVGHRCQFMGLKALENGVIRFAGVRVPKENLIGAEGMGLKIALVTLNTGRLSLPAACVGGARRCLNVARSWTKQRVQWGQPVGHHEAISHKLADLAATTFAMESWSRLASELATREGYDIRLEAAAAKEYCSVRGWELIDDTMQIRGGRGYETDRSLTARGEPGHPIERMMRDSRINRIFEGSSEIMHLFMARELVDRHLQVAGPLFDKRATVGQKLAVIPKLAAFYGAWYPSLWLRGLATPLRYRGYGALGAHLRFAERGSRRLARAVFHAMVRHGAGLERKQALLFRTVDIAMELAVMVAVVLRAHRMVASGAADAVGAAALADLHCRNAARIVAARFEALARNDDDVKASVGRSVCDGQYAWTEGEWAELGPASPASARAAAK